MTPLIKITGNKQGNFICKNGDKIPLEWNDLLEEFYLRINGVRIIIPQEFQGGTMGRKHIRHFKRFIDFSENN